MYLLNYTLDNLSLMALTISTGFVVDDAVVVIENITRHLEQGMEPFAAAMRGSREIGFTVLSMSLSLVAVFLPILLMTGIVGRLFREFAIVLSAAIAVSLVVSLTTTPMMCARFLKAERGQRRGWAYRMSERVFQSLLGGYETALRWVLRNSAIVMVLTLVTIGLNVHLFMIIKKGFFPQQDTGRLNGTIQAGQDASFQSMQEKLARFSKIVKDDPAVDDVEAFTGTAGSSGGGAATNAGRMFIDLKPLEERKMDADAVIARLRTKLARVSGATLFLQSIQDLRIGGRSSSTQYQFTLSSDNLDELNAWAPKMFAAMKKLPQIIDVSSDQQNKGLETALVVDRDRASRLQITQQMIDDVLYDSFGQRQVSTIFAPLQSIPRGHGNGPGILAESAALKGRVSGLPQRRAGPARAFADFKTGFTPLTVNHQGQFPSVTLSFNLPLNGSLGEAVDAIGEAQRKLGIPAAISASFQGTAQAFQDSLANQPWLILAALLTVYIVLGILYESLIHPITILSTLPSAGVGALLALMMMQTELERDCADRDHPADRHRQEERHHDDRLCAGGRAQRGRSPEEAIFEACILRFRPIMMTTMAALLGGLPLALGRGIGLGTSPPVGHRYRRRADLQPDADAVHHAGDLSLPGSPALAGARRWASAGPPGGAAGRRWRSFVEGWVSHQRLKPQDELFTTETPLTGLPPDDIMQALA